MDNATVIETETNEYGVTIETLSTGASRVVMSPEVADRRARITRGFNRRIYELRVERWNESHPDEQIAL